MKVCHDQVHKCLKPILNSTQFKTILCAEHNTQAMEEQMGNYANENITKQTTDNSKKSKKCNQCEYASSHTGHLRAHLKTHSGEKSNECNQCYFASSQTDNFRTH